MCSRTSVLRPCAICVVASLALFVCGCPMQQLTGDPVAGEAKSNATCAGCHTAASLAGHENLIRRNMGLVSPAMAGITLTDQEVADLKAFIAQQ
jgi:mono/diheme cytochrome c family protein